jgi:hypothetical protein
MNRKIVAVCVSLLSLGLLVTFMAFVSNFLIFVVHNATAKEIEIERIDFGFANSHIARSNLESRELSSYLAIYFSPNIDAHVAIKFSDGTSAVSSCRVNVNSVDVCPLYIVGNGVLDCSECTNR